MSKKKLFLGLVILVVAIVAGWYFLYFTKTPTYSLNLAREAVEKHDVNAFKKHVDVESIIGSGYDDYVDFELDDPELNNSPFKGWAVAMLKGLKPQIVSALSDQIYQAVSEPKSTDENNQKDEQAVAEIKQKSGVEGLEFKDIGSADVVGDKATVPLIFTSKDLGKDVTLNLEMTKLDDGTWKAVKITNFVDFLKEVGEKTTKNK